jgi:predicted metal-dependent hydrolase
VTRPGLRGAVLRAIGWTTVADDAGLRKIELDGAAIEYRVVRAARRSIGIRIGLSGVTVRAPHRASLRSIEGALREHAAWVQARLALWHSRRRTIVPTRWIAGMPIAYRGETLSLALVPARRKRIAVGRGQFSIAHPTPAEESAVASYATAWLRRDALRLLAPEAIAFARRIGAPDPTVRLSRARTRWGSCNAKGQVRLNARLIHLPPELARYVVAHEVAHLVHLDHSPRFWALVESLHEQHREARRELAEWAAALDA